MTVDDERDEEIFGAGTDPCRPKVLQIVDSLDRGGAQKLVVDLSEMLGRSEVDVTVLALAAEREHSVRQAIEATGATVVTRAPAGRRSLLDLRRLLRMVSLVKRGRFDVVHTHLFSANVLGCLAAWVAGVPAVATLHSTGRGPRHHDRLKERLEGLVLRRCASSVVAVGRSVADAHRFKARERSIVPLLNPVRRGISLDDEERRSLRNEMGVEREGALLVSVGRLAPEKGIADLLRAIAIVRSTQPSVRLALAGTGDLDEPLRALVSQLGLEGSVRLLGWRDDVRRLLAASDVYVSASYWEGLPMAILEAMASALPIVATGVGEIPSLLAEQRGVVVPPGDVDGLADALGRLVAEPDRRRRLGDAAQRYVNQHCAVDEWGQRVLALYRSVNPSLLWPAPSGRTPEHTPPCAG